MSYTRDWSNSTPVDHTLVSNVPTSIRNVKTDVSDRIATIISGFVAGETVFGILNLPFIAVSAPSTVTDQIQLYAKAVAGKTELFFKDEDGNERQLTSGGKFIAGMAGEVRMWSGLVSAIPTGWQLCDGTNGSPDLRGKMIPCTAAGVDPGAVSGNGYLSSHTHVDAGHTHVQTAHRHSLRTNIVSGGRDSLETVSGGSSHSDATFTDGGGDATGSSTASISSTGSATFYALAYIYKT